MLIWSSCFSICSVTLRSQCCSDYKNDVRTALFNSCLWRIESLSSMSWERDAHRLTPSFILSTISWENKVKKALQSSSLFVNGTASILERNENKCQTGHFHSVHKFINKKTFQISAHSPTKDHPLLPRLEQGQTFGRRLAEIGGVSPRKLAENSLETRWKYQCCRLVYFWIIKGVRMSPLDVIVDINWGNPVYSSVVWLVLRTLIPFSLVEALTW